MNQEPALQLKNFGVCFGRRVILSSVELTLPASGIDVLMGPIKTGKSTLLRSLAGVNQDNAIFRGWGEALLQGKPLAQDWRPLLVQQHAAILSSSVRDALIHHYRQTKGLSLAGWNEFANQALVEHGLDKFVPSLDTPMLSLPREWQRAINILSHALVKPPLLMIIDPTNSLDDAAANRLIEWLKQLGGSVRLLVTLHHQAQARRLADRIILLGGGRVLAHADNPDFFKNPPNDWASEFIRHGNLTIASPDARAEELNPGIAPPPPLPEEALAAIAEFPPTATVVDSELEGYRLATPSLASSTEPETVEPAVETPAELAVEPAPAAAVEEASLEVETVPADTEATNTASEAVAAEEAKQATAPAAGAKPAGGPVPLPPSSINGVRDASMVGMAGAENSQGPQGFHWIIPGKLAGCAEPGSAASIEQDLAQLADMGIKHLISLTEEEPDADILARHGLRNLHLSIFDGEAPSINQAYMLMRRMQVLIDDDQAVAVYSKTGGGRTGTVLATWLIREGGLSAASAIERLRSINPEYVRTPAQESFLQAFEEDIVTRI